MRDYLIIRLPVDIAAVEPETEILCAVYSQTGQRRGEVEYRQLNQVSRFWADEAMLDLADRVVVLVPGTWAASLVVSVNEGQRKHLRQALPYLVEDSLATEIEQVHLANRVLEDNRVGVSILPHAIMQRLTQVLGSVSIDPFRVVVESQLGQAPRGGLQLTLLEDHVLVAQHNNNCAVALDYAALGACLQSYDKGSVAVSDLETAGEAATPGQDSFSSIEVMHALEMPDQEARLDYVSAAVGELDLPVEYVSQPGHVLDLLARRYFKAGKNALVDMQIGGYQSGRRLSRRWRRWRPLAWVACSWLALEMMLMIGKGVYFQQLMDTVSDNTLSLYQQYFPQDRQISDTRSLRQRLMSKLKAAEQQGLGEQRGEPFLPTLLTLSDITLKGGDSFYVESLDYNRDSGVLVVQMEAASFDVLDSYIQELKVAGLTARLENANQGTDVVEARINIGK